MLRRSQTPHNPFDAMREHADEIVRFGNQLPGFTTDVFGFVNEAGEFYCSVEGTDTRGKRVEFVNFQRGVVFTKTFVMRRISEDEAGDAADRKSEEAAGMVNSNNWRNWNEPAI